MAPNILITGGRGKLTMHNTVSEASSFSAIMYAAGVPKDHVLIEDKSSNTAENVQFSYQLVKDIYLDIFSAIVVTKPYMERRAKATFAQFWPELNVIVTSEQVSYEEYMQHTDISREDTLNVMLGDLQRIMDYPAKGWMVSQEIPKKVIQAYESMLELGYNKFAVK